MAILKLGSLISGIRGSVGGVTFSANGAASYAKSWSRGLNPRTSKQSAVRSSFSSCRSLWLALSDAQRAGWATFAALPAQALTDPLGTTYYASGWNWFCRCNCRLLAAGASTISAAPSVARPSAPTISAINYTEAAGLFLANVTFPDHEFDSLTLIIFAYPAPTGAPLCPSASRYSYLLANSSIVSPTQSCTFNTEHIATWGYPVDGWSIFLACYAQTAEGLRSSATPMSAVYPT